MIEGFEDLTKSTYEKTDLSGSTFRLVLFDGSTIRDSDLNGVTMRGVGIEDTSIDGEFKNLVLNGVDVAPIIEAELDRRDPDRPKFRATTPAGFREAWDVNERRWSATVDRARRLPAELLHESVGGEWSFVQTLRHLAFATETWLLRAIQGNPRPWHPLSLPFDEMAPHPEIPWDREARVSLDEALELRTSRTDAVTAYLAELDDDTLDSHTDPVDGPGWPPAEAYPVRECLLTILNEEWHHRQFAERDLDALTGAS
jgi:uncharacterized damage-inducible protein DinB